MRYLSFLLLCLFFISASAQQVLHAVVADSVSRKVLPFATIRSGKENSLLTGVDGRFHFSFHSPDAHIIISYVGYITTDIHCSLIKDNDTIFLSPSPANLKEVTVMPQTDKIRHILSMAIRNKPMHNPDMYDRYQCSIYYKMHADLLLSAVPKNDLPNSPGGKDMPDIKNGMKKLSAGDSNRLKDFMVSNHMIFSETYSWRYYKRPMQVQEDIIASRFSGLKKTYFTSLVTDVMPFHVYGDYITLNGTDYINPVAKGWQQRYQFRLADEIYSDGDTIYILTFRPKKNTSFHSLKGIMYINSDGYAISNFISSTGDSSDDREIRIEQKYSRTDGKWFPEELNYDVLLKKYPTPQIGIRLNGHSIISNISFNNSKAVFQKARPVALGDSVDLYTEAQWKNFRPDSVTQKEKNTYHTVDSFAEKVKLESKANAVGKLAVGKLGIGSFDFDINRIIAYNQYEGTRLGLGVSTNEKVSKYFSVGGWAGFGFSDSRWKYGAFGNVSPFGEKDNWIGFSYQDNYQSAGDVHIHSEVDKEGFRNWLLNEVDEIKQSAVTIHTQRGYWEIEAQGMKESLHSFYNNNFETNGEHLDQYDVREAGIGIKYAYAEKRIPLFGYYVPYGTKYPVVYFRINGGHISSGDYGADYLRSLMAVSFTKHFNRWGNDRFQLEAGMIHSFGQQGLSRSFLLAGKGFRNDIFNYYAWGGFLTMRPYDYFSDRYISFFYRHDFDKFLWRSEFSKPFISVAHNLIYGELTNENKTVNMGIETPLNGYHETGILVNQLVSVNYLHLANLNINAGIFYHWGQAVKWNQSLLWAAGLTFSFN